MAQDKNSFLDDLTFIDSWKDKTVQLAAGGALIAGTGVLVAKGRGPNVARQATKTLKQMERNADRYILKHLKKPQKLVYQVGKNVVKGVAQNVKNITKQEKIDVKSLMEKHKSSVQNLDPKKVQQRAFDIQQRDRNNFERNQFANLDSNESFNPRTFKNKPKAYYEERAKQELIAEANNPKPTFKKKMFGKDVLQENIDNIVGAGLAGGAFATGISIVHALDSNPKAQRTYEAAGSLIRDDNQTKGYNNMNNNSTKKREFSKQASVRDIHETLLSGPGKKIGGSILSGIGFGTASVGFNEMNKRKKEKEEAQNKKQNRIIIEFDADKPIDSTPVDGGTGLVPRPSFDKLAGLQNYTKNLLGRKTELRDLNTKLNDYDYIAEAANHTARQGGIPKDNPFSQILGKEKGNEKYLESQAHKLRQEDKAKIESIKDDVAKAQTYTIGGLGIAGAAGLAASNRKKEENKQ